jgi:histidinol-phosphate phosphatase family protein
VFVDRDGTLVREVGYLASVNQLELLPGAAAALHALRAAGCMLVAVTNQSGVARGLFPLERVYQVHARLRRLLARHGVALDAIYFCPHHPDEHCPCRKPRPGLLERAAEDLLLDLHHSFVAGDKLLDVETAHAVGARGVLVRSGYGREEERRAAAEPGRCHPDHVAEDLGGAAAWMLRQAED